MIVSIYEEVGQITEQDELAAALKKIGYYELFENVIASFPDNWVPMVRYIILAYSIGSDYTAIGENWLMTKRKIADLVKVPKDQRYEPPSVVPIKPIYLFEAVVELKIKEIGTCIQEYLNLQDDREFTHLMSLRESYQIFVSSPYRGIEDDQIYKNMGYAKRLLEEMREFEETLRQKWEKGGSQLYEGRKESDKNNPRRKTLSLESRFEG